ncbi:AAEL001079-PA [Aedes aegypti]|uniref:CWH43-like N-terminal domain-containing protein n=2 Tax=Aedes aegypti TaxID=7159 RepID=A0A8W7H2T1_AEDAE|nr:post-GPI attachment to proteins factor 2-like isoform X1 [Aedes aegypti]XP_021694951.1 post-GPI attachment to proteins factor 2-like isoform X1 [Aedes aegypti]EAT47821.1 AAEL001079-PA [Aedes aegypti]
MESVSMVDANGAGPDSDGTPLLIKVARTDPQLPQPQPPPVPGPRPDPVEQQTVDGESNHSDKLAVHLIVSFRDICVFTLVLPLGTLFVCFVSAYVFQPEEIHETHCRVYNVIPSISAITGVSPQRYLWRISIALHIGPRIIIAFVYKNYYRALIRELNDLAQIKKATSLLRIVHGLNIVEISALCCVTYVSNKENYPVHEKVFILFMTSSLSYMLATLKLLKVLQPNGPQTTQEETSLRYKRAFFALSIASTIGLILFFLKHRFLCHDLAFSWFALCEYIVASANMGFHCTTMLDFPTEDFMIAKNANRYRKKHATISWKLD